MVSTPHCCSILYWAYTSFLKDYTDPRWEICRMHVQNVQHISVKWINNKVQNTFPCSYKEQVTASWTTTKIVFGCCRQRSFTYSLSFLTAMHITEWYTVTFHNHWNSKKDRLSFNYRRATTVYSAGVEPWL